MGLWKNKPSLAFIYKEPDSDESGWVCSVKTLPFIWMLDHIKCNLVLKPPYSWLHSSKALCIRSVISLSKKSTTFWPWVEVALPVIALCGKWLTFLIEWYIFTRSSSVIKSLKTNKGVENKGLISEDTDRMFYDIEEKKRAEDETFEWSLKKTKLFFIQLKIVSLVIL